VFSFSQKQRGAAMPQIIKSEPTDACFRIRVRQSRRFQNPPQISRPKVIRMQRPPGFCSENQI
jgi:hypothetical protein